MSTICILTAVGRWVLHFNLCWRNSQNNQRIGIIYPLMPFNGYFPTKTYWRAFRQKHLNKIRWSTKFKVECVLQDLYVYGKRARERVFDSGKGDISTETINETETLRWCDCGLFKKRPLCYWGFSSFTTVPGYFENILRIHNIELPFPPDHS